MMSPPMTRRWRIRLTILIVLLGIPAVLGGIFVWITTTGRAGAWLSTEYALHMPGRLKVGGLEFTAADTVRLTDVSIGEGFSKPLFTVKRIEARIDLFKRKLVALDLIDAHMRLDEDSYDLLQRIIAASGRMPRADPPQEFQLRARGSAEFASGAELHDIVVDGPVKGPLFELTCSTLASGEDPANRFFVDVVARYRGGPGGSGAGASATRRVSVMLKQVTASVPMALDAVASIGLLPKAAPNLVERLPSRITVDGSILHTDDGAVRFLVPAQVSWKDPDGRSGRVTAQIDADQRRFAISGIRLDDSAFGNFQNATCTIDLAKKTVALDSPQFAPGAGLGIPAVLPVEALLKQAPRLAIDYGIDDGSVRIALSDPERSSSRVTVAWAPDTSVRVDAAALPLTIAQALMPAGLVLGGGQATSVALVIDAQQGFAQPQLKDLRLTVAQARASWNGWSVGPADGTLAIAPQDDGSVQVDAQLAGTSLVAAGSASAGTATVNLPSIDGALARVHGPVRLPSASGSAGIELAWKRSTDGSLAVALPKVALSGLDLRFDDRSVAGNSALPSVLQAIDTTLRGDITWKSAGDAPARLTVKTGGQLASGRLRLPTGRWLDLAAQTPIFTADVEVRPSTATTPALLSIRELLVRGAGAGGTPRPDGYSAQFSGTLDEGGSGTLRGLVDHVNLDWVDDQAQLPQQAIAGDGALTLEAVYLDGSMERLSGHFLPFNAEVKLGTRFRATGITGDVSFTLGRSSSP